MNWLWLNIPFATLIFLAMTLIPLWLVIRHPDTGAGAAGLARRAAGRAAVPVPVRAVHFAASDAWPHDARNYRAARQLELAGDSRR